MVVEAEHFAAEGASLARSLPAADGFQSAAHDPQRHVAVAGDFEHFEVEVEFQQFFLEALDQFQYLFCCYFSPVESQF